MYPIFLAVLFGAVVMHYTAIDIPMKEQAYMAIRADVSATNFLAYRASVQRYLQDHPGVTGAISDVELNAYWMSGYVRDPRWTNIVDTNTLYVYSTHPVERGALEAIWKRTSESVLVGNKSATSGRLVSYNGTDTGIVLPTAIPNGALVMIGR